MNELTARQARVLRALASYIRREGIAPTFQELGSLLGMTPASARQHVLALEKRGVLRRRPRKSRAIVLVARNRRRGRRKR